MCLYSHPTMSYNDYFKTTLYHIIMSCAKHSYMYVLIRPYPNPKCSLCVKIQNPIKLDFFRTIGHF